jgi:brefeldin A-resistance guanine nucleotide exchange factor 1
MSSPFHLFQLALTTLPKQEEAVPESLKNMMLVMAKDGYLVPPTEDPSKEKLWTETWKRLDRFLPDLRKELPQLAEPETQKEKEEVKSPVVEQVPATEESAKA